MHIKSKTIGETIRNLREKESLTQEELALLCGWTTPIRVKKYESGEKKIPFEDALSLAYVFGVVPAMFLAEGSGDVEFIKYKCSCVPVVGDVIGNEIILKDFVLTHEGAYDNEKHPTTNLYKIYGLKVSSSSGDDEYSEDNILIVEPYPGDVDSEHIIVKYGIDKYFIKKQGFAERENIEIEGDEPIIKMSKPYNTDVFFVIGSATIYNS